MKVIRLMFSLLIAVVFGILFLVVVVQIPQVRNVVVVRLLEEVNELLEGELHVNSVEGDLLTGLELRGVGVKSGDDQLLFAKRITARWNLLSLVSREIEFTGLWIDGLSVSMSKNRKGEWDLGQALSLKTPSREKSPWTIAIGRLEIREAEIQVVSPEGARRIKIERLKGALRSGPEMMEVQTHEARITVASPAITITGATGRFEVTKTEPRRLRWKDIQIDLQASSLRSSGNVGLSASEGASIRFESRELSPLDLTPLGSPLSLPFSAQANVEGPWEQLQWSFSAASTAGAIQTGGSASLPFTSQTTPDWKAFSLAATGSVIGLVPAKWLGNPSGKTTRISTDFKFTGARMGETGRKLMASFDGHRSRIGGIPVRSFVGSIRSEGDRVRGTLKLVSARSDLTVSGRLNLSAKSYAGTMTVKNLHPEDWLHSGWAGRLNASARFDGVGFDPDRMTAKAKIVVTDSRIGPYGIRRVSLPLQLAGGIVSVNRGIVDTTVMDARLHGQLPIRGGKSGRMNFLARVEDLSLLYPAAATQGVVGRAMVHARVFGSLEKMTLFSTLHGSGLGYGQALIPDLDLAVEGKRLNVLKREGSLEALVRLTAPVFGGTEFEEIVAAFSTGRSGTRQDGTFYISALKAGVENRFRGRYEIEIPRLKLILEDFAFSTDGNQWLNQGEAVVDVQSDSLVVRNLDLRNGQQQLLVDGTLSPEGNQNLRIRLNRVQLGQFGPMLAREQSFGGQLDGSVWLTGTLTAPIIESTLALADGTVGNYEVRLVSLILLYRERWLTVELRLMQSATSGMIVGDAKIPIDLGRLSGGQSRFDHRLMTGRIVSENVSLKIVEAVTDQIENARGAVNMDVRLGGSLREPLFQGELRLTDGGFRIRPTKVTYSKVSLAAVMKNRTIEIESVQVHSGDSGLLSGGGEIVLASDSNPGRFGLRLVAANLLVVDNKQAVARVDADLTLTGSPVNPVLTGAVSPLRVLISPPSKSRKRLEAVTFDYPGINVLQPAGIQATQVPTRDSTQVEVSTLSRAQINVVVLINRNVWIRNDEANVELGGQVSAFKDAGHENLRFVGEIQTVRGFYRLQGKRLDIDEGRIIFSGTEDLNPLLDISLNYEVPDYLVTAHVTGTLRKPVLDLSSQPPLEESDILAVILFGRPFDSLEQGEQVAMRERVGQLLGGFAAEELRRQLGGQLGIDTLEISPAGESADEAAGPTVGVGKYLSQDVFVQYLQRFGAEAGSEVRLEYYFTKHWLVQTSADTGGQSGLDVFWRVTF